MSDDRPRPRLIIELQNDDPAWNAALIAGADAAQRVGPIN
jgi:hypothetical protein